MASLSNYICILVHLCEILKYHLLLFYCLQLLLQLGDFDLVFFHQVLDPGSNRTQNVRKINGRPLCTYMSTFQTKLSAIYIITSANFSSIISFPVFWRSSLRAKDQSTTSNDIPEPEPNVGDAERELMDFSTDVKERGRERVCER